MGVHSRSILCIFLQQVQFRTERYRSIFLQHHDQGVQADEWRATELLNKLNSKENVQ
jgi:hypothetical protein